MPIEVTCPECRLKLKAPDSTAGKNVRCKRCGEDVRVPKAVPPRSAAKAPSPLPDSESQDTPNRNGKRIVVVAALVLILAGGGVAAWLASSRPADQPEAQNTSEPVAEAPKSLTGDQIYKRLLRSTVFILMEDKNFPGVVFTKCGI